MAKINIRVTDEIKAKFKAKADAKGLTESEYFRQWVLDDGANFEQATTENASSELTRIGFRLPKFLIPVLQKRAAGLGMSKSRFIASLVQSNLIAEPVMTKDELAALYESTIQLTRIGTNINQIAKSLNEHFYPADINILESLKTVSGQIIRVKKHIQALQSASHRKWMN